MARRVREFYSHRTVLWPRVRSRASMPATRQVIVATAGRVGSTWTCNLLRAVGLKSGPVAKEHKDRNGTLLVSEASIAGLEQAAFLTWYKSHSLPPADFSPAEHPSVRFVTVLRDPRDMLVSAADFLAWLDVGLGGLGKEFAALSERDRILTLIETGDWFLEALERWQQWPHAFQVHYEQLSSDPVGTLARLLDACDLKPRFDVVARAVRRNDFTVRTGRQAGVEAKGDFRRKGIVGDWRTKFDSRCIERFALAKEGRWLRLADALARSLQQERADQRADLLAAS